MADRVEVWAELGDDTVRAGSLYPHRGRGTEAATFIYDEAFLANSEAFALDPVLTLDGAQHQTGPGQALFGALADCAPDRWGRGLVERAEKARAKHEGVASRSLSEIDYLLGVRDDLRQGALRFRLEDGPFLAVEEEGIPPLTLLPELLALAGRAEGDDTTYEDLKRLLRVGSSLGGARPKAHVRAPDGRAAIAKFPSAASDTWNVPAWEKVALDLARQAGIVVPDSTLLDIDGRSVLVVDRFDRADDRRIGYVSAMTMLEATDGAPCCYLDIADTIEQHSPSATEDLHQLWRRIVFTVLISNTDDHLRNHGFLHVGGDSWTLSPAFDLNPNPAPGPKELSTAIDYGDATATIVNALGVVEYFRLDRDQARDVVGEVEAVVSRWQQVAEGHGLSAHDRADMASAFEPQLSS